MTFLSYLNYFIFQIFFYITVKLYKIQCFLIKDKEALFQHDNVKLSYIKEFSTSVAALNNYTNQSVSLTQYNDRDYDLISLNIPIYNKSKSWEFKQEIINKFKKDKELIRFFKSKDKHESSY